MNDTRTTAIMVIVSQCYVACGRGVASVPEASKAGSEGAGKPAVPLRQLHNMEGLVHRVLRDKPNSSSPRCVSSSSAEQHNHLLPVLHALVHLSLVSVRVVWSMMSAKSAGSRNPVDAKLEPARVARRLSDTVHSMFG